MNRIRLRPSASITPTPSGVVLRSDLGVFHLQGADVRRFLTRLVPLLDGSRDTNAVQEALPGYSGTSIRVFLTLLTQKGLVESDILHDLGPFQAVNDRQRSSKETS